MVSVLVVYILVLVGLEPTGNVVGAPARFTVETSAAGTGEVEVVVTSPKGTPEKVFVQLQQQAAAAVSHHHHHHVYYELTNRN